jgi:hypothetical protein
MGGGAIRRTRVTPDRYVYHEIMAHRDQTMEMVDELIVKVAKEADLKVQ